MIKQFLAASLLLLAMTACGNQKPPDNALHPTAAVEEGTTGMYTSDTRITEVVGDPVFGDYGRLIFPAGNGYYSGDTLGNLSLTWYTHIDPEMTVEVANYFRGTRPKGRCYILRHLHRRGEGGGPGKREHRPVLFQRYAGSPLCRLQCGRCFCLCGSHT